MYQFGKLIVDIEDALLWQLKMNLQSSNVAERHTAEKALTYLSGMREAVQDGCLKSMEQLGN